MLAKTSAASNTIVFGLFTIIVYAMTQSTAKHSTVPKGSNSFEDDEAFLAFVRLNLDSERYKKIYGDVAAAGTDPVEHWLNFGLYEGRSMAPGAIVLRRKTPHRELGATWRRFVWRGDYIAVRLESFSQSLAKQIIDQARHDPAVLPSNAVSLDCLPFIYRPELINRDGVDVASILAAISVRPKLVIVLANLRASKGAKFGADLTGVVFSKDEGPAIVLVTEQSAEEARNWEKRTILSRFRAIDVVFWRDVCGRSHANARILAILLNVLRPKNIVVIDSHLGFEAVARFGKALSQSARLYCAYLGAGVNGMIPVAMKFVRHTLPFAVALVDNDVMAAKLWGLYRGLPGKGIAVLPRQLLPASEDAFATRLGLRQRRVLSAVGCARWVWVSPSEPLNGYLVLAALAAMRPQDRFEIFGSLEDGLKDLCLAMPNIIYRCSVEDAAAIDLGGYDGFVFAGLADGMPNIVLEMSQHAIPMVLADNGDLRATFGDSAAMFVQHGSDAKETAANFARALDRLVTMLAEEISTMVITARDQALIRYSPAVFARVVAKIFHLG